MTEQAFTEKALTERVPTARSTHFLSTLYLSTLFLSTLYLPTLSWAADAAPLTLAECYRLALEQSETIAIRQELIEEAEARFTQALSGILPRVSFVSTDKRQDGNGQSAFTLRKIPERKFTVNQPLFSGFREFAAMAGTKAERRQREHEKRRAEQLLLVDTANAFYLLLELRENLRALETTRDALANRLEELRSREQLGRSRPSEVVSAEAQRLRVDAEIETAEAQALVARQLLEFLTGWEQIPAVTDPDAELPFLDPEMVYLDKALSRPDVHAAEEAVVVAEKEISIAKADIWPSVDLDGAYYTERVGNAKDVTWDATLTVDVPIFQGGEVRGAIQQAASEARQTKWLAAETRRRAVRETRDLYAKVTAGVSRTAALAKALDAADESYRFQAEDYRRALVNNLDVLQSLQTLEDVRRDYIRARHETKRLYWELKATLGDHP